MAKTVDEIMNRELFSVPPGERADRVLAQLLSLDIGSAPVLDGDHRPLGVVSLRDLVEAPVDARVGDRMSTPAISVLQSLAIEAAAARLAEANLHHAPVVDGEGRVVGVLSAIDLLRGLTGQPARHPAAFARRDPDCGAIWSDDTVLAFDHVDVAPDGPGVLALIHGGARMAETVVWVEASLNVRERLVAMLSDEKKGAPQIAWWLERGHLRFRCASVPDAEARAKAVSRALAAPRSPG